MIEQIHKKKSISWLGGQITAPRPDPDPLIARRQCRIVYTVYTVYTPSRDVLMLTKKRFEQAVEAKLEQKARQEALRRSKVSDFTAAAC